jgi:hypothetical protein
MTDETGVARVDGPLNASAEWRADGLSLRAAPAAP